MILILILIWNVAVAVAVALIGDAERGAGHGGGQQEGAKAVQLGEGRGSVFRGVACGAGRRQHRESERRGDCLPVARVADIRVAAHLVCRLGGGESVAKEESSEGFDVGGRERGEGGRPGARWLGQRRQAGRVAGRRWANPLSLACGAAVVVWVA